MVSNRSKHKIEVEGLSGSDTASRFDGHEHGACVSFFTSRNMTNGEKDRSIGILHKQFLITR